jgi:hypothetical protein
VTPKTYSLYQYKLASFYIILCSMHTNICHNKCNPGGYCPVKLFTLNNWVYVEELRVGIESIYRSTYIQTGRVKYLVSGDVRNVHYMARHVGVILITSCGLWFVHSCILLSAFVVQYTEYTKMHGMGNIKHVVCILTPFLLSLKYLFYSLFTASFPQTFSNGVCVCVCVCARARVCVYIYIYIYIYICVLLGY